MRINHHGLSGLSNKVYSRNRLHVSLWWFFVVIVTVTACSQPHAPPLRVGTNVWPGYEPLYLAREQQYIDDDRIRLVEYSSASQVIRAYRNGVIDAAALTMDEALLLQQYGLASCIVLVFDISHGGDVIVAQPHFRTLEQLEGKRFGVEDTALGAFVLSRALQKIGLTQKDVHKVPLEVNMHERAYDEQMVDAVVTFEPVRSKLLAKGGQNVFDSKSIESEIMDVLIIRENYLMHYPDRVSFLLQQWFRALEYLHAYPQKAAGTIAKRLKIPPKDVLLSYEGIILPDAKRNRELLLSDSNSDPDLLVTARKISSIMIMLGLLNESIQVEPLFSCNQEILYDSSGK